MSDFIGHECGLVFIRLKKDLSWYNHKYGDSLWGLEKLFLLMEKQHNRGQDGVGIGCCKIDMPIGCSYLFRARNAQKGSLEKLVSKQYDNISKMEDKGIIKRNDAVSIKNNFDFGGEILLGHLRYGTSGKFGMKNCHPYFRKTNYPTKTLMVLGNFNMTNARDLNHHLINRGQHPIFDTDTQTVLEEIGFHLDQEHNDIYRREKDKGLSGPDIQKVISDEICITNILNKCGNVWDGGYAIAGVVGNGVGFVLRDPNGIRPCYYYENDEVIAFTSERIPLMSILGAQEKEVKELPPGHVGVVYKSGDLSINQFTKPSKDVKHCVFERIYFSRGNDPDIYKERIRLGEQLVPKILKSIDNDLNNTIFSFIPNTAEIAYEGLMNELRVQRRLDVKNKLTYSLNSSSITDKDIDNLIISNWPRGGKIIYKDLKLRTFIQQENGRKSMVSNVYDVTYGIVKPNDTLVVIDDSIVRGTTLKQSIIKILSKLNPKKIIIVSTAPQVRFPDFYGIDMSQLGSFVAFNAVIRLINSKGNIALLNDVYNKCKKELDKPINEMQNAVKLVYEDFSEEDISKKISEIVSPEHNSWEGEVEVIYQGIEEMNKAIPNHSGDWVFTGNYPTPGGIKLVNKSFINYMDSNSNRPYDIF